MVPMGVGDRELGKKLDECVSVGKSYWREMTWHLETTSTFQRGLRACLGTRLVFVPGLTYMMSQMGAYT